LTVMDTLPAILKENIPDSQIVPHVACDRTKTTSLMKNVLAEYGKKELIKILKVKPFFIRVDETTDRTCTKHLWLNTYGTLL
jgi:hypothetical protein